MFCNMGGVMICCEEGVWSLTFNWTLDISSSEFDLWWVFFAEWTTSLPVNERDLSYESSLNRCSSFVWVLFDGHFCCFGGAKTISNIKENSYSNTTHDKLVQQQPKKKRGGGGLASLYANFPLLSYIFLPSIDIISPSFIYHYYKLIPKTRYELVSYQQTRKSRNQNYIFISVLLLMIMQARIFFS